MGLRNVVLLEVGLEEAHRWLVDLLRNIFIQADDDLVKLVNASLEVHDPALELWDLGHALLVQVLQVVILGKALKSPPDSLPVLDRQLLCHLSRHLFHVLREWAELVVKFILVRANLIKLVVHAFLELVNGLCQLFELLDVHSLLDHVLKVLLHDLKSCHDFVRSNESRLVFLQFLELALKPRQLTFGRTVLYLVLEISVFFALNIAAKLLV